MVFSWMDKFATVPLTGVGETEVSEVETENARELPQEMVEGHYSKWLQTSWLSETSYFTKPGLGREPQEPDIFLDHLVCQWQQQQKGPLWIGFHLFSGN